MPASRSARAMTLAPRSWPSSPGLATSTRILDSAIQHHLTTAGGDLHGYGWWPESASPGDQIVLISKLRQRYQQATLRYGAHGLAIFSMSLALGSFRFL